VRWPQKQKQMKSYTLEFSKTLTQVLFLVLYPILACVLFFGAMMLFDDFFTIEFIDAQEMSINNYYKNIYALRQLLCIYPLYQKILSYII
jgi:hypothetical protein